MPALLAACHRTGYFLRLLRTIRMSSGESFGVDLEIPAGGFCFLAFSFTGVGSDVGSHGREQSPSGASAKATSSLSSPSFRTSGDDDESAGSTGPAPINLGAGPVEPADSSSAPEVRNDGDDKDDVALADAPLGDCSRPCEPTSLPTPVKENAKKQKPPAGISKSTPKLSPKLMRIILDALREYPVLRHAAKKAGIHRKTPEYWIRCSAAGHDGYDIKWQGIEWRFHEHCESAIWEAELKLLDRMFERAFFGYDKVLTRRGRVVYKLSLI